MPEPKQIYDSAHCPDAASAEEAIRQLDVSISSDTAHTSERAGHLLQKAVFLGVLDKYSDANSALDSAAREAPDDPSVQLSYKFIGACLLHKQHKLKEAFEQFTKLIRERPEQLRLPENRFMYEEIQQWRAFEAAEMGDAETAIPLLKEILSFDLNAEVRASALGNIGILCFQKKQYTAAKEYLLNALKLPQPLKWLGRIHLALAISFAYLKSLRDAQKELLLCEENAAEWGVSLPYVYGWLAMMCKHLGEIEQAKHYERLSRPT